MNAPDGNIILTNSPSPNVDTAPNPDEGTAPKLKMEIELKIFYGILSFLTILLSILGYMGRLDCAITIQLYIPILVSAIGGLLFRKLNRAIGKYDIFISNLILASSLAFAVLFIAIARNQTELDRDSLLSSLTIIAVPLAFAGVVDYIMYLVPKCRGILMDNNRNADLQEVLQGLGYVGSLLAIAIMILSSVS